MINLRDAFKNASAAHIAIDLQNAYCDPNHTYANRFSTTAAQAGALAEPVSLFAQTLRNAGLCNIWVAHAFTGALDGQPGITPEKEYRSRARMARRELFKVKRTPGDLVICKEDRDAFQGTRLDLQLKRRNIRTLLLTGAFFDQCIKATAKTGAKLGYDVFVVRDLTVAAMGAYLPGVLKEYEKAGVVMAQSEDISAAALPEAFRIQPA